MKKDIITITKNAWGKLEQIINKSNNKHGFIFGVTSGGCNGFNFDLRLMQKEEYEGIQKKLASKTGCKINALRKIVKKGQGAYFSSGSRPNQTAHSWGYARLASSITGGKAAAVDFNILKEGCKKNSKAYKYALKAKNKHKSGTRKVAKFK